MLDPALAAAWREAGEEWIAVSPRVVRARLKLRREQSGGSRFTCLWLACMHPPLERRWKRKRSSTLIIERSERVCQAQKGTVRWFPIYVSVVSVYAPTFRAPVEEKEKFYSDH